MPDLRTARSGRCGAHLTWTLDPLGTLTVAGEGDLWDYDRQDNLPPWSWERAQLRVREVILRPGVTGVGNRAFCESGTCVHNTVSPWADGEDPTYPNHYLSRVILPDTLTRVGEEAFRGCKRLLTLELPEGLAEIGALAFADCKSLLRIALPRSLTRLGEGAFAGCGCLKQFTAPDHIAPETVRAAFEGTPRRTPRASPHNEPSALNGYFPPTLRCENLKSDKDSCVFAP